METPSGLIESLFERIESFTVTTYELSKLKALETVTVIVTSLVSRLTVIVVFILFFLILNLGIALFLGEILGRIYYGFFIVAAFYLVAGVILHLFLHKWIRKPLGDMIVSQALQ